jgi:hypothetical protein
VVSETLQLNGAGACVFSYLLKAEPDGYSDGLCRACAPHAPAHRTVSRDPFSRIITIAISIQSDWDGDDIFCGASHVRQTWDGCHLDPPERRLGKPEAPVEERHTGSLLLLLRFLRSCAWCGCRCTRFSDCGVMTYRTPGTQVALSMEVGRDLSKGPLCVVEWSRGRGASCYSCFVQRRLWPDPATRRYLNISKLRLRKKRKKRRNSPKFA